MAASQKITPHFWFHTEKGTLGEVLAYYQVVFGAEWKSGSVISLGNTPSGYAEMCSVELFGSRYSLISTESLHHPFNDAASMILTCEDQSEIDHYWNYFTQEGQESQCGWCQDKFGFRWQVIPQNLGVLLQKENGFKTMMRQTKIVVAEYK
ncbi:MAG: yteG protein [Bacteroidota bacterium]